MAETPVVEPLEAPAANQELVSLLTGWQWQAVVAAREAGASWAQIGEVTDTTTEQARGDYLARIEGQERYGLPDAEQLARYRAVLEPDPQPHRED